MTEPTAFEVHELGVYLHGTKAVLKPGELLTPGHPSNYEDNRALSHVYVTETLAAAAWGAQLARGNGPAHIYVVEPTGELEDDPNVTDKEFPGNPTRSYRTRQPVRVLHELEDWPQHSPESVQAMRDGLAQLDAQQGSQIID